MRLFPVIQDAGLVVGIIQLPVTRVILTAKVQMVREAQLERGEDVAKAFIGDVWRERRAVLFPITGGAVEVRTERGVEPHLPDLIADTQHTEAVHLLHRLAREKESALIETQAEAEVPHVATQGDGIERIGIRMRVMVPVRPVMIQAAGDIHPQVIAEGRIIQVNLR